MPVRNTYLEEHQPRFVAELLDFLRIPSVSSLPEYAPDLQKAAEWLAARLRSAGVEVARTLPTGGPPVVFGEWRGAPGKPTIMVYGHYDVQPADPVARWSHPPFAPIARDGRIHGRGASDDKGNLLAPVLAVEAMLRTDGTLPVNLKFFFEGEEEIGSPHLAGFADAHREELACDLVVSADGTQWSEDQPALLIGSRGMCAAQIDLRGPASDLHSGVYGGAVQNPLHAMVQLLGTMRGPGGRVLVEGFFDDVVPLTGEERARLGVIPYDEAEYRSGLGVAELFGEPGYTTLERAWARPTLEVNGIWGGFQGQGIKTVIPREAHAKITCRLVPDQHPARVIELLSTHVKHHTPPGVTADLTPWPASAMPYLIPAEHPGNQAAGLVLEDLYGKRPFHVRTGGSVALYGLFLGTLGVHTVSFGFGLEDENMHAPDEFFRLKSLVRGQRAYCLLLEELGRLVPAQGRRTAEPGE